MGYSDGPGSQSGRNRSGVLVDSVMGNDLFKDRRAHEDIGNEQQRCGLARLSANIHLSPSHSSLFGACSFSAPSLA